jgi:hypothetical protein
VRAAQKDTFSHRSMPRADHGPPPSRHRSVGGLFKDYVAAAVSAADRIDYWIRRQVIPFADFPDSPPLGAERI